MNSYGGGGGGQGGSRPLDVYLWRLAGFLSRDRLRTSSPFSIFHSRVSPLAIPRAWASARGIETKSMPCGCCWTRTRLDMVHLYLHVCLYIYSQAQGVGECGGESQAWLHLCRNIN